MTDHVGGATEPRLPERMAQHGNGTVGSAAAPIVSVGERPTERRAYAEHIEHPSARAEAVDRIDRTAL